MLKLVYLSTLRSYHHRDETLWHENYCFHSKGRGRRIAGLIVATSLIPTAAAIALLSGTFRFLDTKIGDPSQTAMHGISLVLQFFGLDDQDLAGQVWYLGPFIEENIRALALTSYLLQT